MAGRRTKASTRFGFVRFKGVRDTKQLEHQLDKIMIENINDLSILLNMTNEKASKRCKKGSRIKK